MNIRCESLDQEAALHRHGNALQLKKRASEILPLCQRHLNIMRLALTTHNPEMLEQIAKDLVTLLGELSPPAALDMALQIERLARTKNLAQTEAIINCFERELAKLQDLFTHF